MKTKLHLALLLAGLAALFTGCSTTNRASFTVDEDGTRRKVIAPKLDLVKGEVLDMHDFGIKAIEATDLPDGAIFITEAGTVDWGTARLDRDLDRFEVLTRDAIALR